MTTTVRRVNLLPREIEHARRARQRVFAVVLAAVGVVALLVGAYAFQLLRLNNEKSKLEATNATNTQLRAELATLADFAALQKQLDAKTKLVTDLTNDEVRWSVILADISMVIPQDAWLTNFSATVSPRTGAPNQSLATIQMNGTTFTHVDVAVWLTRLTEVDAFVSPYLSLSAKGEIENTEVVNFNSTVQLSDKALRNKQAGAQRKI